MRACAIRSVCRDVMRPNAINNHEKQTAGRAPCRHIRYPPGHMGGATNITIYTMHLVEGFTASPWDNKTNPSV